MLLRKPWILVAALAALNAFPRTTARAQDVAVFGSAEGAGDNTLLFLLGASGSTRGIGWKPYVTAIGYNLHFDNGGIDVSRNVFAPQAGLRYQTATGSVQAGVGYSFTDDDNISLPVAAPSGKGVFGAFQWDYWGTGKRSAEFIASYGTDEDFLWSRLMGFQRLTNTSPLHVGGEAIFFGSPTAPSFWSTQLGPAIEWRFTPAFRLGAAAGFKIGLSPSTNNQTDAYGRLSFLWLPTLK